MREGEGGGGGVCKQNVFDHARAHVVYHCKASRRKQYI